MVADVPEDIAPETAVHRVGGGNVENLRLSALELELDPPGISLLLDGTPQEAASQMKQAFPRSKKWNQAAATVGTASVAAVRQMGFDIEPDPTSRFPNHARLIHPDGAAGFSEANLEGLERVFSDTAGC